MKTFDCFLFFNELDLLELRLRLLDEVVDYFVLVESAVTFQGEPKEYVFEKNKERFARYLSKIVHFKVPPYRLDFANLPYIKSPQNEDERVLNSIYMDVEACPHFDKHKEFWWGNDFFQRECIRRALVLAQPAEEDLILLSDVDEIPDPVRLRAIQPALGKKNLLCLRQNEFCYYLNYFHNADWLGSCCFRFGEFRQASMNALRFAAKRDEGYAPTIMPDGGWHFTSLGSVEAVRKKIQSWGHREYNNSVVLRDLEYNIRHGYDVFRRPGFGRLQSLPLNDTRLPPQLSQWCDHFAALIGPAIEPEGWLQKQTHALVFFLQSKLRAILRRLRLAD